MITTSRTISCALMIICLLCSGATADEPPTSVPPPASPPVLQGAKTSFWSTANNWADVEDQLIKCGRENDGIAYENMKQCAIFQRMLDEATANELLKLVAQDDHFLTKLAAFYAIREKHPASAVEGASTLLLSTQRPALPIFGPVYDYLKTVGNTADHRQTLDKVATVPVAKTISAIAWVAATDPDLLNDWFENTKASVKQPLLAAIVAQLYSSLGNRAPTRRLVDALDRCREGDSFSVATYLSLASENAKGYKETMQAFLANPASDDKSLLGVIGARPDYIEKMIDVEKLAASEQRRSEIKRRIELVKKSSIPMMSPSEKDSNANQESGHP